MPAPLFLSSGDLIADRRYDFARDLQLRGDIAGAADLMAQAVERAPGFASAWFALGELKQQLNLHGEAIQAFRKAQEADPADRHGAKLRLMRLGVEKVSGMPPAYVRSLFDQYAPTFEDALLNNLNYRGPDLLLKAVLAACRTSKRPPFFKSAIDLGCGTGLAARAFEKNVESVVGIDLSPGMVAQAQRAYPSLPFSVGSMLALDLADGSLAGLVAYYSIVNIPRPELPTVFAEFARVLVPGGVLLMVFQVGDEVRHGTEWLGHPVDLHVYRNQPDAVAGLLAEAGLAVRMTTVRQPDADGVEVGPRAYLMATRLSGPA